MTKVGIDIGYSSSKIQYNGEFYKIPTSISYSNDVGISFGEANIYTFEGEQFYVGEAATDEAFTTTDYTFLAKFAPLIIYHIIKKLGIKGEIELRTGLALSDWDKQGEFFARLSAITVNDETLQLTPRIVGPQGDGAYIAYLAENNLFTTPPKTLSIIEIGYRTVNFLYYENGKAQQNKCKGFPGHGAVSIMKTFTNYLESTYGMPFSEQEALKIFMSNELSIGGSVQAAIPEKIADLKNKFVQKLMKSVLISEKKTLMLSEKVLIAGGGAYFVRDVKLPENTVWNQAPYEFANVKGYMLAA